MSKQSNGILKAIADFSKQINGRIDDLEYDARLDDMSMRFDAQDLQFEAIRQGIV